VPGIGSFSFYHAAADRFYTATIVLLANGTMLANALFGFASGLKTQVIESHVLGTPALRGVKARLSEIADELHGGCSKTP
jgi:hypothetical protein